MMLPNVRTVGRPPVYSGPHRPVESDPRRSNQTGLPDSFTKDTYRTPVYNPSGHEIPPLFY